MEMFSKTNLSGGSMHLLDDSLQTHFNCGDKLHDGTFWSLILTLMQSSKCRKVIVEMVNKFQLFFQTLGEKDIYKVSVLI